MNNRLSKIEISLENKKFRLYPFLRIQDVKKEAKILGSHFQHKKVNILSNGEQFFLEVLTHDNNIKYFDYLAEISKKSFSQIKNEFKIV